MEELVTRSFPRIYWGHALCQLNLVEKSTSRNDILRTGILNSHVLRNHTRSRSRSANCWTADRILFYLFIYAGQLILPFYKSVMFS